MTKSKKEKKSLTLEDFEKWGRIGGRKTKKIHGLKHFSIIGKIKGQKNLVDNPLTKQGA